MDMDQDDLLEMARPPPTPAPKPFSAPKPTSSPPPKPVNKVKFQESETQDSTPKEKTARKTYLEKTLNKNYPGVEELTCNKILDAKVEVTCGQLFAMASGVTDIFKKKITNRRLPVETSNSAHHGQMESEDEEEQDSATHYSCPLGYVRLTINGQNHEALLDTGSMVNIMPEELAHQLGLVITQRPMNLKGIGGHHTKITGIAEGVEVLIGKVTKPVHFWVAQGGVKFIIGKPFLLDFAATIQYNGPKEESLSIRDKGKTYLVPIILPNHHKWETSLPAHIVTRDFLAQRQDFNFSK